jgi:hypothetical protein
LKEHDYVSGVILFTNDFFHGRYIENRYALASNSLSKQEIEDSGIIAKTHEPLITHDNKIDFPKLSKLEKENKLSEFFELEKKFDIDKDSPITPYSTSDTIELSESINDYLYESNPNKTVLKQAEDIIKKYCNYRNDYPFESYDDTKQSDELHMMFYDAPIRAYAAPCLILLTYHDPSTSNKELVKQMSQDANSYVRGFICRELHNLYMKTPELSLTIARRYYQDNKLVRFFLHPFLTHIYLKDPHTASDLFLRIIDQYGKDNRSHDRNNLLTYIVPLIIHDSLSKNKHQEVADILNKILEGDNYNHLIKKELIFVMREDKFLLDSNKSSQILLYFEKLIQNSSKELIAEIDFFLLYNLVKNHISLYPKISNILKIISLTKFRETYGYDNLYHFQIIKYLQEFYSELKLDAVTYLYQLVDNNPFLLRPYHAYTIVDLVRSLYNDLRNDIETNPEIRSKFLAIINRIETNPHYDLTDVVRYFDEASKRE